MNPLFHYIYYRTFQLYINSTLFQPPKNLKVCDLNTPLSPLVINILYNPTWNFSFIKNWDNSFTNISTNVIISTKSDKCTKLTTWLISHFAVWSTMNPRNVLLQQPNFPHCQCPLHVPSQNVTPHSAITPWYPVLEHLISSNKHKKGEQNCIVYNCFTNFRSSLVLSQPKKSCSNQKMESDNTV